MGRLAKVRSLDEGEDRGIIPALLVVEIEQRSGVQTSKLHDPIAGTSTRGSWRSGPRSRTRQASCAVLLAFEPRASVA